MGKRSASQDQDLGEHGLLPFRRTVVATDHLAVGHDEVIRMTRAIPTLITEALPWKKHGRHDFVAAVTLLGMGRLIRFPVDVEVASPEHARIDVLAQVHWHGHGVRWLFPAMDGDLFAKLSGDGRCRLTLVGTYEAPFRILGVLGDLMVTLRVARPTDDAFVQDLGHALERTVPNERGAPEQLWATNKAA